MLRCRIGLADAGEATVHEPAGVARAVPGRSFDGADRVGQGTGRPRPLSLAGLGRRLRFVVVHVVGDGLRAHRQVQSPEQQQLLETDEQQAAAVGMKEVRIAAYACHGVYRCRMALAGARHTGRPFGAGVQGSRRAARRPSARPRPRPPRSGPAGAARTRLGRRLGRPGTDGGRAARRGRHVGAAARSGHRGVAAGAHGARPGDGGFGPGGGSRPGAAGR